VTIFLWSVQRNTISIALLMVNFVKALKIFRHGKSYWLVWGCALHPNSGLCAELGSWWTITTFWIHSWFLLRGSSSPLQSPYRVIHSPSAIRVISDRSDFPSRKFFERKVQWNGSHRNTVTTQHFWQSNT